MFFNLRDGFWRVFNTRLCSPQNLAKLTIWVDSRQPNSEGQKRQYKAIHPNPNRIIHTKILHSTLDTRLLRAIMTMAIYSSLAAKRDPSISTQLLLFELEQHRRNLNTTQQTPTKLHSHSLDDLRLRLRLTA